MNYSIPSKDEKQSLKRYITLFAYADYKDIRTRLVDALNGRTSSNQRLALLEEAAALLVGMDDAMWREVGV